MILVLAVLGRNTKNVAGQNMDNEKFKIKLLLKKIFSPHKDYFRSLWFYILIAIFIFFMGATSGYYFAEAYPSQSQELLSLLRRTYEPVLEMNRIAQILFIFLKNSFASFLVIILGVIFGILPVISLISNGEILGVLANSVLRESSIFYFFLGILPHGIIEIPCFLISSAIGLRIGKVLIKKILRRGGSLKEEFNSGLSFFLRVLLPLLFLAALIEVLISSELLRIY